MATMVDSLEKLSVENNTRVNKNDRTIERRSRKLTLSIEEKVSPDENYILAVCGTQRQILHFFTEYFTLNYMMYSSYLHGLNDVDV